MTTLHDGLSDLAEGARPPVGAPTADELWRRGRSRARRRIASTVAVVATVAVLVAAGTAALAERPQEHPGPVAPTGRTVLPDRFFTPSGWLPTTDRATGPLVAVVPTTHGSWTGLSSRMTEGLVGVSATTQAYAFLDLPGWVGARSYVQDSWSLSANGRWLAYYYGPVSTSSGFAAADGVAVRDNLTGTIRRHPFAAPRAVVPQPFAWTGDTVWFGEFAYISVTSHDAAANLVADYAWDLADPAPHEVQDPHKALASPLGPAFVGGFVAQTQSQRWLGVTTGADLSERGFVADAGSRSPASAALSPDGARLAVSETSADSATTSVVVGTVVAGAVSLRPVPGASLGSFPIVRGWLDDNTVLVDDPGTSSRQLVAVDVTTGATRVLSTFNQTNPNGTQLAADLLRSPVVQATAPPRVYDPRLVALVVLAGVVAAWLAVAAVRRRRRAA